MSRPANPYDNASCESFIKTLKREEINANRYLDLEDLHCHVEEFIDGYYNQKRLHSALGYQTPEEFEAQTHGKTEAELYSATLRFFASDPQKTKEVRNGRTKTPMRPKIATDLENQRDGFRQKS